MAGKLDFATIITIAVSCSVGGLVLCFLLWRSTRACRSTSAPLPPVQPLAYDREQQQQHEFDKAVPSWGYISSSSTCSTQVSKGGPNSRVVASCSSLLPPHYPPGLQTDETSDTTTSSLDHTDSLSIPTPSPYGSQRSHSEIRDSTYVGPSADAPLNSSPFFMTASSFAHLQSNHSLIQQSRSTLQLLPSHSRPLSTHTSLSGRSKRNTIRGSPHGPHSSIQIVLPAPLAFQLNSNHPSRSREDFSHRKSYVDKWAITPSRSTSKRPDSNNLNSTFHQSSSQNSIATHSHSGRASSLIGSHTHSLSSPSSPRTLHHPPRPQYEQRTGASVPPIPPLPSVPLQIPTIASTASF